jgi:hypothetical protein
MHIAAGRSAKTPDRECGSGAFNRAAYLGLSIADQEDHKRNGDCCNRSQVDKLEARDNRARSVFQNANSFIFDVDAKPT